MVQEFLIYEQLRHTRKTQLLCAMRPYDHDAQVRYQQ